MLTYFQYEKERVKREKIAEAGKAVGKPRVGGKFELVDHEGRRFGDEDMKGGFTLVSFSRRGVWVVMVIWRDIMMKLGGEREDVGSN